MSDALATDLQRLHLTPAMIAAAVATITHHAADEAEARTFCQQLGLLPTAPARR